MRISKLLGNKIKLILFWHMVVKSEKNMNAKLQNHPKCKVKNRKKSYYRCLLHGFSS